VNEAARRNPYSTLKLTLSQEAADLLAAFRAKLSAYRSLIANADAQRRGA
jgi:hypothetical protein